MIIFSDVLVNQQLHLTKLSNSTLFFLRCLSARRKLKRHVKPFLKYCRKKKGLMLLAKKIFAAPGSHKIT